MNQREMLILGVLLAFGTFLLVLPYRLNPERMFGPHTDLTQAFYVNFSVLRDSILQNHRLPFWDNSILAGRPVFENPLFLAFYPPTYLLLISKTLPMGIFVLMALHLFLFAFFTAYLVGKRIFRISLLPQIFLGFAALLLPKAFIYWAIGHVFTVFFLPFIPLIFFLTHELIKKESFVWSVVTGISLALAFIVDVRMSSYFLFVISTFCVVFIFSEKLSLKQFLNVLLRFLLAATVFLILVFLPFYFFSRLTSLTTRISLDLQSARVGSVSFFDLLRFFLPNVNFDPKSESFYYPGLVVIFLVAYLIFSRIPRESYRKYIASLLPGLVLLFIFSLDFSTKFLGPILGLPIFRLLRIPSRAFLVMEWFLIVLASLGFAQLINWWQKNVKGFSSPLLGAVLIIFLTFDLANYDYAFIYAQGPYDKNPQYQVIDKIKSYPGRFRIFSVDHSIDQKLAYEGGLELVDGEDPFQLENFVNFSNNLLGLGKPSYVVSYPPSQIYSVRQIVPSSLYLSLLNVRFVVSKNPINANYLKLIVKIDDGLFLYEFEDWLPRAYLVSRWDVSSDSLSSLIRQNPTLEKIKRVVYLRQDEAEPLGLSSNYDEDSLLTIEPYGEVEITKFYQPDEIIIKTDSIQDSVLVLDEIFYPGWKVTVDGEEKQLISANDILRGVFLLRGQHEIKFFYRPFSDLGKIIGYPLR